MSALILAARVFGRLQRACVDIGVRRYYYDPPVSRDALIAELCSRMERGEEWHNLLGDPRSLGHGERIPEYTYTFETLRTLRPAALLDVGCVLNNPIFDRFIPDECEVSFLNPASEPMVRRRATYFRRTLTEFAGPKYPFVTCLSTLEHIGFDNTRYGTDLTDEGWDWPQAISCICDSIEHLTKFVGPGGTLLVSCPFGRKEYVRLPPKTGVRVWQVLHSEHVAALKQRPSLRGIRFVFLRLGASGWEPVMEDAEFAPYGSLGPGASGVMFAQWRCGTDD